MAEIALQATPILGGIDRQIGANRIVGRDDLALVSVAIPLGGEEGLAATLQQGWSLALPGPRQSSNGAGTRAIRTAPDQILLICAHVAPDARAAIRDRLGTAGYITDQSDVWAVFELAGPDTRAALERLCPLDLHPDVFPQGASARTVMEHMGAIILRSGADRFVLLSARSSAGSFLHAVETSFRYVLA